MIENGEEEPGIGPDGFPWRPRFEGEDFSNEIGDSWKTDDWDDDGEDQSKSTATSTGRQIEFDPHRLGRFTVRSAAVRGTRSGPAALIVALVALSWIGGQVPAYIALSTRGLTATGLVTGEGQSCGDSEFACTDVVRVEFSTQQGRKTTFWDGSLAGLESGDTVEVIYDPDSPTTAEIGGIGEQRGWVIVYGLGLFLTLLALIFPKAWTRVSDWIDGRT